MKDFHTGFVMGGLLMFGVLVAGTGNNQGVTPRPGVVYTRVAPPEETRVYAVREGEESAFFLRLPAGLSAEDLPTTLSLTSKGEVVRMEME
jgi:hypothetical protein